MPPVELAKSIIVLPDNSEYRFYARAKIVLVKRKIIAPCDICVGFFHLAPGRALKEVTDTELEYKEQEIEQIARHPDRTPRVRLWDEER